MAGPAGSRSRDNDARDQLMDALVRPSSVLVLGASARKPASANQALANLQHAGYAGEIHVVHREAAEVEGFTTIPAISRAPHGIDVALVSLPASAVVPALLELEEQGCRSALVPSVGLDDRDRAAIRGIAARGRMVVHGPNTFGIVNNTDGVPLVFWDGWLTNEGVGNVALIAQSGGATVGVVKSMQRRAFSKILPTGSEWDLSTADYLRWLARDPATDAVGVVMESVVDVPGFVDAVHHLRASQTRLVVLNVGRSTAGAVLAQAHTSGLVGRADAYRAFFADLDVPVVDDYDELASALDCLAAPDMPTADGSAVAVITESGGIAALVADLVGTMGGRLATFGPETREALTALLPGSHPLNPYDSGGSLAWTGETFAESITTIAGDPAVSSLMAVVDAQGGLTEAEFAHERENAEAIAAAASRIAGKPVIVVSSSSIDLDPRWRTVLGERTPLVRGIRNGLVALRALSQNQAAIADTGTRTNAPMGAARDILTGSGPLVPGPLSVSLGRQLLEEYGVPLVRSEIVSSAEEGGLAAMAMGFPVVIKVVSPDIPHRSDIGAVMGDIHTPDAARDAVATIIDRVRTAAPHARIEGFEVQQQLAAPFEVMIGSVLDPVFGPVVTVGLGGVLVEVLGDVALALAPIDQARAQALIDQTRLGALTAGYRNLVPVDCRERLASCISAFSHLVADASPTLVEAELNPVLIDGATGRVAAVDWLFVSAPESVPAPTSSPDPRRDPS